LLLKSEHKSCDRIFKTKACSIVHLTFYTQAANTKIIFLSCFSISLKSNPVDISLRCVYKTTEVMCRSIHNIATIKNSHHSYAVDMPFNLSHREYLNIL